MPPESQVHKQVVRKRAEARDYTTDPAIRLHYVEVAEPDMRNPRGDFERLADALGEQWGLSDLACDLHVLQGLQRALRDGEWSATVAVHAGERIVAVWPGFRDQAFGAAFDIGSTTIACHLTKLSSGAVVASAGRMNPQIRFGEDLMSRVSYVMMNPGGETELTEAVRGAVNALIGEVAGEAGIERGDILNAAFVGNPIMHHLLLGIDPTELGGAPFALARSDGLTVRATDIELDINPGARVYVLPCVAGHVGADAAGVVLSEAPHRADETVLIVDVGTNAEIVLGNKERLLAASSPTGPAFEGAQITAGQRAAPGAIERVRIDRETLEARIKVIGCDLWSDEEGFADTTAATGSHRHLRLRASSRRWPRCISPESCSPTAPSPAPHRPAPPASWKRGGPSATCSTRASPPSPSTRTTCAPSSSPRRRSWPAHGCSWTASRSSAWTASC